MYERKYHEGDLANYSFLVTGGAGFIGSNLVEYLLKHGAGKVRVLDNFATGYRENVAAFENHPAFEMIEGDIRHIETCRESIKGIDYISHQAALGSVRRSINDPLTTNDVNVTGFLNMLCAAKEDRKVKRFVYAASSSTYGDSKELPKVEPQIGNPLSPYAVTKYVNELYAGVFAKIYDLQSIGLRYFNIFGPRQSPNGEYAAVIPRFIQAAQEGRPAIINGDGEHSRDFTFVENAIQANIKAFFAEDFDAINEVYNVACGDQISLNQLWQEITALQGLHLSPVYRESRKGDVKHSKADITKAQVLLNYKDLIKFSQGMKITVERFKG